jgi:hypothetical protein
MRKYICNVVSHHQTADRYKLSISIPISLILTTNCYKLTLFPIHIQLDYGTMKKRRRPRQSDWRFRIMQARLPGALEKKVEETVGVVLHVVRYVLQTVLQPTLGPRG